MSTELLLFYREYKGYFRENSKEKKKTIIVHLSATRQNKFDTKVIILRLFHSNRKTLCIWAMLENKCANYNVGILYFLHCRISFHYNIVQIITVKYRYISMYISAIVSSYVRSHPWTASSSPYYQHYLSVATHSGITVVHKLLGYPPTYKKGGCVCVYSRTRARVYFLLYS